jgi:hypothetical protein
MLPTQLGMYNDALIAIGERKLATLTDNSESRRVLDNAWTVGGVTNGAPLYCLELGLWNFATRSSLLAYNSAVEPPFGFAYAFNKPTDWLRTGAVCSDPYFKQPLADTGFADEAGYWFADLTGLYVKYVSSDPSYGLNMALWPMSFTNFLSLYLAQDVQMRLVGNKDKQADLDKRWARAMKDALGLDGSNKPTAIAPLGSWAGARIAGRRSYENR